MPGVPLLPEELLELIFSYFKPSEDLLDGTIDKCSNPPKEREDSETLAYICLVSKQCCRLAQPYLYHTIHLVAGNSPYDGSNKLQRLVRTLVYQPVFASYVVKLCVDGVFLEDAWGERDAWDLSYEDAIDSSYAFDQDDVSRQDLLDNLRHGTSGAHTALLLAMCQDAQSMRITLPESHYGFTGRVLFHAGRGSDPSVESKSLALSYLKVLALQNSDDESIPLSDFANLFSLPKLEVFRGYGIDCTADDSQYDIFASNLTRIDLWHCLVDAEGLRVILQACPKLEDIAITWGDELLGVCEINFNDIGRHLEQYGKSLRNVTFDTTQAECDYGGRGGLGDLSSMESLKILSVPADVLVGGHVRTEVFLPTSLECLDLDLAGFLQDEDFWQQLRKVAATGGLYNLEAINCGMGRGRSWEVFWSKADGYQVLLPPDESLSPSGSWTDEY